MSLSSSTIKPLTKENYDTWVMQIEAVMVKNGTWVYVNGRKPKPEPVEGNETSIQNVEKWEDEDAKAKSDLIIAIDPSLLRMVKGLKTSKQIWDKLKSEYASTGPVKRASLLKRVTSYKITENDDFHTQLMEFFDIIAKLSAMGVEMHNDLQSTLLLNALPPSFEMFRCAMESQNELPKPDTLREKVIEKYEAKNQRDMDDSEVMWVRQNRRKFKPHQESIRGYNSSFNKPFKYKCFKCHQNGHKAADCPNKPSDNGQEYSSKVESQVEDVFEVTEKITEEALHTKQTSSDGRWCLDSGCTSHMCNNEAALLNMTSTNGNVLLASDAQTEIVAKGTARVITTDGKVNRSVKLNDTLLVKELRTNLLSVARITDHENTVSFHKTGATIFGKNGEIKLLAQRIGNLYYVCDSKEQANAVTSDNSASLKLWHHRLGHLNKEDLLKISRKGLAVGIKVNEEKKLETCDVCLQGKMSVLPFPKKSERCTTKLELIHTDVWGPSRIESLGRARYFVTFIDDSTRWCEVRFIRNKSDVLQAFKEYKARVETQTGCKIKCLMSDNGKEYCNKEFDEFLKKNGICRRLTIPHTPQQNGVAERKNRTLIEMARCLLIHSGLSHGFWAEAVATSNYLRNRCPTSSLGSHSPFEAWNEEVPDLSNLKVFGAKTFVLEKGLGKSKFDPRSQEGILVGYSEKSKGYRVWIPIERKVVVARDVRILENQFLNEGKENKILDSNEVNIECVHIPIKVQEEQEHARDQPLESTLHRGPGRPRLARLGERGRPRKIYNTRQTANINEHQEEYENYDDTETQREPSDDEIFVDAAENEVDIIEEANLVNITLKEAMTGDEAAEWMEAITEEIRGLIKNNTWKIVERPKDRAIVTCKIVLRNKLKPDGTLERRKARVVARGFTQRQGIDFTDTFAPVARLDSVRLLMALAAREKLPVFQLDIVAAYLNGNLEEEIFMEPPEYIQEALQEIIKKDGKNSEIGKEAHEMLQIVTHKNKVCKLRKALYGLRQAGRQWHKRLSEVLQSFGLTSAASDTCFYYNMSEDQYTILVIYVDDILYISKNKQKLNDIKTGLAKVFEVKDLGLARHCLGVEINQENGEIELSQQRYIKDLLKKFNMEESNPVNTPSDSQAKLPDGNRNRREGEEKPFRQLIGSLMYLAVATRPDITFTVNRLSQFNEKYQDIHWSAAKRVLRYLRGTQNYGLVFKKDSFGIQGYSDADHANDIIDRISYTGYVFMLSGAAISWRSKKQQSVAISSTEAEYVALSETSREALYLRNLMLELDLTDLSTIDLGTDNRGAKYIAENATCHSRTKHIATRYHFIRQLVKNNELKLRYIPTEIMPADILTKPLPGPAHHRHVEAMGLKICQGAKFERGVSSE